MFIIWLEIILKLYVDLFDQASFILLDFKSN